MKRDMLEMTLAVQAIHGIPADKPLAERLDYAFRFVRTNERAVFWMSLEVDDDLMFRAALAAVTLGSDEADRDTLIRSMAPLKALSAMLNGVPVDVEAAFTIDDDMVPLLKMWHETKGTGP